MRRTLAVAVLLGGAAGCAPGPGSRPIVLEGQHEGVTCRACHEPASAGRSVGPVPSESCSSSDCHRTDNPQTVTFASVVFEHRGHGATGEMPLGCAGCHTHDEGQAELETENESCALCHQPEMSGANTADCVVCHAEEVVGRTSQGVEVPHEGLPWIGGGCVRCHYDVAAEREPPGMAECASCHVEREVVLREALDGELHPEHTGVPCTSCHQEGTHRVLALSSAVDLRCADCHATSHEVELASSPIGSATCNDCHAGEHAPQQAFLFGLVDHDVAAVPSEKFMDGVTCRSCHVDHAAVGATSFADGTTAVTGGADGCVACHRPEYGRVLDWWRDGIRTRLGAVEGELSRAGQRIGTNDEAEARLAEAARALATIRDGGGVHNVRLAHRLLVAASGHVQGAYEAAGLEAPPSVPLGPEPSRGLCNYCHFRIGDTQLTEEMDTIFHRDVLGVGR